MGNCSVGWELRTVYQLPALNNVLSKEEVLFYYIDERLNVLNTVHSYEWVNCWLRVIKKLIYSDVARCTTFTPCSVLLLLSSSLSYHDLHSRSPPDKCTGRGRFRALASLCLCTLARPPRPHASWSWPSLRRKDPSWTFSKKASASGRKVEQQKKKKLGRAGPASQTALMMTMLMTSH